jgi:AAA+ superfamily predicted ATPase
MSQFSVGDEVMYTGGLRETTIPAGSFGRIIDKGGGSYLVSLHSDGLFKLISEKYLQPANITVTSPGYSWAYGSSMLTGTVGTPKLPKFKVGDTVKLITKRYDDTETNPVWGGKHGEMTGVITQIDNIRVKWANGKMNTYDSKDLDFAVVVPPKPIKVDLTHLDKLIISDESKKEIIAVLKQHEKRDKMYTEWGLGETIEYGKGMTFLFYGKPGTGKTLGATLMAKALGQELLTIGAAEIQSQEPGGANRNIQDAFKNAKEKNKVLFIDECDSLITDRTHVGMILSSEINTLLTEIEKFEGVCILATNRIGSLDEALERRIALIVEFPAPNHGQRVKIWETLLPKKMPLDGVDATKLADFNLTGGQIKNVILQAARLALAADKDKVALADFEQAIDRVMQSKDLMGKDDNYIQMMQPGMTKTSSVTKKIRSL